MAIEWTQGLDEYRWSARIGNVYCLYVFPGFNGATIHYHAQVCNSSLDELAVELKLPTAEIAKQRAVFLAWQHNNAVADVLLDNV